MSTIKEVTSIFMCDACLRPAVYYSYKSEYKNSRRCIKHIPSFIDTTRATRGKHWEFAPLGITLRIVSSKMKSEFL